jgi:hypothetical protein
MIGGYVLSTVSVEIEDKSDSDVSVLGEISKELFNGDDFGG